MKDFGAGNRIVPLPRTRLSRRDACLTTAEWACGPTATRDQKNFNAIHFEVDIAPALPLLQSAVKGNKIIPSLDGPLSGRCLAAFTDVLR